MEARLIDRLHNYPPEPVIEEAQVAAVQAAEDKRVADLVANATEWARRYPKIETEEIAVAATDLLNQLADEWNKIEAKRVAERKPLRERLEAIQKKYAPWLTRIADCREAIEKLHTAYKRLAEQQREAREAEAARVVAEAQRRAEQLDEQAKAGGPNVIAATIIAREAAEEAKQAIAAAAAVPKRTQIRGSLGGRTHSLRTVWRAEIIEWDECYQHFKDHTKVKELLQSLANEAARTLGAEATRLRRPKPVMRGFEIYSTQE